MLFDSTPCPCIAMPSWFLTGLRLPSAATAYRARTCDRAPVATSVSSAVTPSGSCVRPVHSVPYRSCAPSAAARSLMIGSSTSWLTNSRMVGLNAPTPSFRSAK